MLCGAEIRRLCNVHAHDAAACCRGPGLGIFRIGADISDMRECEGDDLPGKGGVRQDFLITSHGGVEADFTDRLTCCP